MAKSRKIKWTEHVAYMEKLNMNTTFLVGKREISWNTQAQIGG
jgi:hypothetical protein